LILLPFVLSGKDRIFAESNKIMSRPEIVYRIKQTIKKVAPGAKVILYGSEARGNSRQDSDIDLLILINKDKLSYKEITDIT
jgi:predicted nucleotidyltransferase